MTETAAGVPSGAVLEQLQRLLLATLDPRPAVRQTAEQQLLTARGQQLDQFVSSLAALIALQPPEPQTPAQSEELLIAKQIAAVTLKNSISAKEATRDAEAAERWRRLPDGVKARTRATLLGAMRTPNPQVANGVCQVLAKLGVIELAEGEFGALLPTLQEMVEQALAVPAGTDEQLAVAGGRNALTCVAFLCEELADFLGDGDLPEDILAAEHCNVVLTAAVNGVKHANPVLRVAGLKALYYALLFARSNFERAEERNFIVASVAEAAQPHNAEAVRVSAFDCVSQIANEFYPLLGPYMQVLGPLAWGALESQSAAVVVSALEVWIGIGESELELQGSSGSGGTAEGGASAGVSGKTGPGLRILEQALPFVMPLLLNLLLQGTPEEEEEDSWTPAMAAATCLGFFAQVVGSGVLSPVTTFFDTYYKSEDWRFREAAFLALGCICVDANALGLYADHALELSLGSLASDPHVAVRDSAAWTLGRLVQQQRSRCLQLLLLEQSQRGSQALEVLLRRLGDAPRVAVHVCWVLHELAEGSEEEQREQQRQLLDPFFTKLCETLIQVSERPDAKRQGGSLRVQDEKNLREAAFNCLGALVKNAGASCWPHLLSLLELFESQLRKSFLVERTEQLKQRQGMLCGVVQILCLRLGDEIKPVAPKLWETLRQVLDPSGLIAAGQATMELEAYTCDCLLALSALLTLAGKASVSFAPQVARLLVCVLQQLQEQSQGGVAGSAGDCLSDGAAAGAPGTSPDGAALATGSSSSSSSSSAPAVACCMTTADELQAARVAVEVVGDLSRALGKDFAPFAELVLEELYKLLKNPSVDRSLKPVVIVAVGDVAFSLGGVAFAPFAPSMCQILVQAGLTKCEEGPPNWQVNDEWLWYVHELRSASLEALASCVYSLKDGEKLDVLKPLVNAMLRVVEAVSESPMLSYGGIKDVKEAIELAGDLVVAFGRDLAPHLRATPPIQRLLETAQSSNSRETEEKAQWLQKLLWKFG